MSSPSRTTPHARPRPTGRRTAAVAAAFALALAACTGDDAPAADDDPDATTAGADRPDAADEAAEPTAVRTAALADGTLAEVRGPNAAATAGFTSSPAAVLLVDADTWAAAAALPLAAREQAPAVVTRADALDVLAELGVQEVWGVGSTTPAVAVEWTGDPGYTDLRADDPTAAALAVADEVAADAIVCVEAGDWPTALEVAALVGPRAVVVPDGPALVGWLGDHDAVTAVTAAEVLAAAGVPSTPHPAAGGLLAPTMAAVGSTAASSPLEVVALPASLTDPEPAAGCAERLGRVDGAAAGSGTDGTDQPDADQPDAVEPDEGDDADITADAGDADEFAEAAAGLLADGAADAAWLLDPTSRATLPALVTAVARGATPVLRDPADLRLGPVPPVGRFAATTPTLASFPLGDDAAWQWATAAGGSTLPGGGQVLFPGRRLVALYGNHVSRGLGVLGEQGPEAAVERARAVAEPYDVDDLVLVPTFEMIATVASAGAGTDGDYSEEGDVDAIRTWVEAAGEAGLYVVLDLQPGRATYLSQAERYRELLELPHVGLALDPEWRLRPNQVHLRQIGSVQVDEVNEVATWLAELTRELRLPQKLLVVHQFNLDMIRGDRAAIVRPPELAVNIHMDGQGFQGAKDGTYRRVVEAPGDFWWGWKNFYDEDAPGVRSPAATLAVTPQPVFISYQ